MIEAYEKATIALESSESEEEAVEINKALLDELVEIFSEDEDALNSVVERKNKKINEAFKKYWKQMKMSAPKRAWFVPVPDLQNVENRLGKEDE